MIQGDNRRPHSKKKKKNPRVGRESKSRSRRPALIICCVSAGQVGCRVDRAFIPLSVVFFLSHAEIYWDHTMNQDRAPSGGEKPSIRTGIR
jgi:hypothetical protein